MKKITAIETSRNELNDLLKTLTNEGKLVGLDEEGTTWNVLIELIHDTEDFLEKSKTKRLLAKYFNIDKILYYNINDDDTILLVFAAENL